MQSGPQCVSAQVRTAQLLRLKQFIDAQVQKEQSIDKRPRVFLAGSFNVNARAVDDGERGCAEGEEYLQMKQILEGSARLEGSSPVQLALTDLLQVQYGDHPVTFLASNKKMGGESYAFDGLLELSVGGAPATGSGHGATVNAFDIPSTFFGGGRQCRGKFKLSSRLHNTRARI